jgi:hypothetical protein
MCKGILQFNANCILYKLEEGNPCIPYLFTALAPGNPRALGLAGSILSEEEQSFSHRRTDWRFLFLANFVSLASHTVSWLFSAALVLLCRALLY